MGQPVCGLAQSRQPLPTCDSVCRHGAAHATRLGTSAGDAEAARRGSHLQHLSWPEAVGMRMDVAARQQTLPKARAQPRVGR